MNVFSSLRQVGLDAWTAILLIFSDPASVQIALWKFVAALQAETAYICTAALQPAISALTTALGVTGIALQQLYNAISRVPQWMWHNMIAPAIAQLNARIDFAIALAVLLVTQLRQELNKDIFWLKVWVVVLWDTETKARIKDVAAARQYALDLTKALHQTIENEAASGYRRGKGDRGGPLAAIIADLHLRGLISAAVNKVLVDAVKVLVATESPALAAVVTRVLAAVIKRTGIASDLGNYLYGLIIPGQGGPDPKDLPSVLSDVSHRLGAIEDWITGFMLDGGPEVKEAGREWKAISSLAVDAGLLAFFGQAVVAPEAWAREVADTVGVVANDGIAAIVKLVHQA